jgi:hypothetical protein
MVAVLVRRNVAQSVPVTGSRKVKRSPMTSEVQSAVKSAKVWSRTPTATLVALRKSLVFDAARPFGAPVTTAYCSHVQLGIAG